MGSKDMYQHVQEHYGSVAQAENPTHSGAIAKAFGYSEEELNSIPKDANLGLSCGNPLAIASLRKGETVIDLGSGAGFDVFLAAKQVGVHGRAIGVDMNKDMLARARKNQVTSATTGNVSFLEAKITSIPLEDGTADCIISNCVINLVPEDDKPAVFAEMVRLLKPGGRIAISDILARKALPVELRESVALYVSCVAGSGTMEDYTRYLKEAGFNDIVIVDTENDLNAYVDMAKEDKHVGCCGQSTKRAASSEGKTVSCCPEEKGVGCCSKAENNTTLSSNASANATILSDKDTATDFGLADININEWVGSFKIFAVKN